jgi:hypothetical protein
MPFVEWGLLVNQSISSNPTDPARHIITIASSVAPEGETPPED